MKRRSAYNLQLPLYLCGHSSATGRVWPVRFLDPSLVSPDQLLHVGFHAKPLRFGSSANRLLQFRANRDIHVAPLPVIQTRLYDRLSEHCHQA
ncbi:MAG: hypothetical protein WCA94_20015 [Candidatus Acidiferrum sp.]